MSNLSIIPPISEIETEIKRERYKKRYRAVFKSTVYTLITVAAIAILVATLWLPVLEVYGGSMTPTLNDGEIIFTVKTSDFEVGDIVAFYYNNKLLVKRVIATAGEWVNIDEDGNVYVDDKLIDEPYVTQKSLGDCNIELPYQVPDSRIFVLGDHRETSVDSRNTAVGCVSEEQLVGKIIFRVWPIKKFGTIK